jgi:hypothetical protein
MTLAVRRLIYISFMIFFVVAGSVLLFYLQGYRLNISKWQIERTGAIQVESDPTDAIIKINNQVFERKTPTTILGLKPADYTVEVVKAGYQPWRKILTVRPSEVVFSGEIKLWPETNSGTALGIKNLTQTSLSYNGQNLLYLTASVSGSELWLLNLTSGQTRLLARNANRQIINLEWSQTNREILTHEQAAGAMAWQIYNLENNEWENINLPRELNFINVHWGNERNLLYAATATELYEYNRRTQSTRLIWRERLKDFRAHDELIFGLGHQNGEAVTLKILNLSNLQIIPQIESIPLSTNVAFLAAKGKWLPLFDIDRHSLYLLHSPLSSLTAIKQIPEVTTMSWLEGNKFVYTNNFEIWLYDAEKEVSTFIERLSSTLTRAQQYGKQKYIIYSTGAEIWAIEMDERGERQRWRLGSFDSEVQDFFFSPERSSLTVQTMQDIYRLALATSSPNDAPPANSP